MPNDREKILFKDDGSEWYNYFFIRLDDVLGYYFAWSGSKRPAFPDTYFKCTSNARSWIKAHNWREAVDEEFEKEILNEK
jgi:hypothetical protein